MALMLKVFTYFAINGQNVKLDNAPGYSYGTAATIAPSELLNINININIKYQY